MFENIIIYSYRYEINNSTKAKSLAERFKGALMWDKNIKLIPEDATIVIVDEYPLFPSAAEEPSRNDRLLAQIRLWSMLLKVHPKQIIGCSEHAFSEQNKINTFMEFCFPAQLMVRDPEELTKHGAISIYPENSIDKTLLSQEINNNYIQEWIKFIEERLVFINDIEAQAEFLGNLTILCAECEWGIELADHHITSAFSENAVKLFKTWISTLSAAQRNILSVVKLDHKYNIWIIDDQPDKIRNYLFPEWYWKYTNYNFQCIAGSELPKKINQLSLIARDRSAREIRKNFQYPDMVILDVDLRHIRNKDQLSDDVIKGLLTRFPEQLRNQKLQSYGLALITILEQEKLINIWNNNLNEKQKEKIEISHKIKDISSVTNHSDQLESIYKKYFSIEEECISLSDKIKTAKKKKQDHLIELGFKNEEEIHHVYDEYFCKLHREGVILYHYLKAFDEQLPVVVLTADEHDVQKLRQTIGVSSAFLSKQTVLKDNSQIALILENLLKGHIPKTPRRDYWAANELCVNLLEKSEKLVLIPSDPLVKKTKTRILAALMVKDGTSNKNEGLSKIFIGRNFELSQPTGSMCAERSAISQAIAQMMEGTFDLSFLIRIAILGDPDNKKRKNPVGPCGVCSEWLRKLPSCEIIMFSKNTEHFCYMPKDSNIAY